MATSASQLQQVSQLLLELHMTPSYGFYGAAQLLQMMDLLAENQFALRRTRVNAGFLKLHWNRDFEAKSKDNNVQGRDAISLFGIMATAGELWVLSDWLRRHAALYTKLVVIDGANDAVHATTRRLCAAYGNVVLLRQPKEMNVTDQSVRWLAMSVLGDPIGSWIHLAHPDEFYLIDPRQVAAHAEWADPLANVIYGARSGLYQLRRYGNGSQVAKPAILIFVTVMGVDGWPMAVIRRAHHQGSSTLWTRCGTSTEIIACARRECSAGARVASTCLRAITLSPQHTFRTSGHLDRWLRTTKLAFDRS